MRIKSIVTVLFMVGFFTSCIDEFWPKIDKYDNLLVVDGTLTNADEPLIVKLSRSSSLNNEELIPVTGATLSLSTMIGASLLPFDEIDPGIYQVSDPDFMGEVGSWYQLNILLENGEQYTSDLTQLLLPAPIDSLYYDTETQLTLVNNHNLEGVQFYINNHNYTTDTSYYLWRCNQTYEYKASFTLDYIFEGYYIKVGDPDSLNRCWRTKNVPEIFTYSTKNLSSSVITKFPLNFTDTETKMLSIRYSLLVEQLSISEKAFNFWDALRQQNIDQGNLYTQQPIQIRGNIRNVNHPEEPVLGYFTVAGITEKRIFLNKPPDLNFYYSICEPDFESISFVGASPPIFWPIFITDIPGKGWALGGSDVCFDCRLEGGQLTPPDFWEN